MKTSLSGIKPTGLAHLGNILGMVMPAIELQKTHKTLYFIADLHALTTLREAAAIKEDSYALAATFLALGFDAENGALFRQSDIPEITELMWILSCTVSMGDLFRSHAFKAAKDAGTEGQLNLGVFSYPVLMAADILAYDSDVVPVGKDQVQHLEMARAIAKRFNHHFGETFKEPQELIQAEVAIVPGIDGRKMSKSYNNGIEIFIPEKSLKKQVLSIVSDSKTLEEPKDPETCHIFALYKLLASAAEIDEMRKNYRAGNYGYGHAKMALFQKIEDRFSSARRTYVELMNDKAHLDEILRKGSERGRNLASQVLARARKACGLR